MKTLKVGDKSPDFTLPSDSGKNIKLSDFEGKKVVLYFYPKDDTPGCTKQACGFRDLSADFSKKKTVVLGISRDGLESHQKFRKKYDLNFPLLSDEDKKIHVLFGAWGKKMMYGKESIGVIRTTAIIDESGILVSLKHGVKAEPNPSNTLTLVS
ncbi:MAG: thioredoxin-dependent thiol peroxidase [Deltaproteobacteria bacterium]|nr:MAG: thioredoxin-dependent thiol peroxidase [Deltaproteobacteria bacterium]